MATSTKRLLSIVSTFIILFSILHTGIAAGATKNAHGRIFSVIASGGSNSGQVSWKAEYYHYTLMAYSWGVHIYPKNHPFNTPVQTTSCPGSPCSFYIPTPKGYIGKNPTPLKYYFVVFASNVSGGFASDPSVSVTVKFAPTKAPSASPVATTSSTPTPTPTPSQTPTPTPRTPSISDFDGSYSGFLNVSLTPAILPIQVIPFTLQLINGKGQGRGGSWRGSGAVSDPQGNATVTISNAIYGSFTVPITFSLNISTQKKTGTGSGSYLVPVRGFGEITFDFTFNVATK